MRSSTLIGAAATGAILSTSIACSAQAPAMLSVDEVLLREYGGAYQWGPKAFVYLQQWNELTGTNQLVAFDESGEVRVLFPTERDRFFTGPGAAVATEVESRIAFERDRTGRITSLTWRREGAPPRIARRVEMERWEDVRFANGEVQLAGTLITPRTQGRHSAVILVHGSGPESREGMIPFARFLVRRGLAVLTCDNRGVGGSSGDRNTASFEDLASDVVAAFAYLKTRSDVDRTQIGLLGVSQAGWIMPLAAVRAPELAFLISISGPGVPAAETTIDHTQREMTAAGMRPEVVSQVIHLMHLRSRFARTGQGWDEYAAARQNLASRLGSPPETFPGHRSIPRGNPSAGCTSTIPHRSFGSSSSPSWRSSGSSTRMSCRKRTRQPGRRHSHREAIRISRCRFCRRRTTSCSRRKSGTMREWHPCSGSCRATTR